MIRREDLVRIGQFNKPHGIKGELSFTFTDDSFDESNCPFLICELDGIFVPFYLEEYRFKSDTTALVKLKRIDSDQQARMFINLPVYFPKEYINQISPEDSYTWDYFIGYTLIDKEKGPVGKIIAIDDSTINVLFIVEYHDGELLIPAIEEIILEINEEEKEIQVELPEGILEL